MMRKLAPCLLLASLCSFAHADDAVYDWVLDAATVSGPLSTAANWRGGVAPDNSGGDIDNWTDARFYMTNAANTVQSATLAVPSTRNAPYCWAFGTFVGDAAHWLCLPASNPNSWGPFFEDASGFEGFYYLSVYEGGSSVPNFSGPILRVREGYTNTLPQFLTRSCNTLRVYGDNAGGTARIGRTFGRGLFRVGDSASSTYHNKGSEYVFDQLQTGVQGHLFAEAYAPITLNGPTYDEPKLPAGAAFHADASKSETLTLDSKGSVTEWRDADGGTVTATRQRVSGSPNATRGTSTNGLAVVQLAANAYFQLSRELAARELFVVFRHSGQTFNAQGKVPQFVGNDNGNETFRRTYVSYNYRGGYGLFEGKTADSKLLDAGETWYDGTRLFALSYINNSDLVDAFHGDALHVVSAGLVGGSAPIDYLGAGYCVYKSNPYFYAGSIHLAEVVIYEKSLTSAERREANAYLRKKWQNASHAADWDLGTYSVRTRTGASTNLTIASGHVGIRELNYLSQADSVVKRGAGTLTVEQITPADKPVVVEEGSLKIRTPDGAVREEMAPKPYVWLDASQSETLVDDPEDPTRVILWWDPRPAGSADTSQASWRPSATNKYTVTWSGGKKSAESILASPKRISDTPTGRTALDFGPSTALCNFTNGVAKAQGTGVMYVGAANMREGFVVLKAHDTASIPMFGRDSWWIFGTNSKRAGDSRWTCPQMLGGYWTINGRIVDPSKFDPELETERYYVFGFRPNNMSQATYLGGQRINSDGGGGVAIAEVIYYERVLTPEERRNTEAYLMRKWLGDDHPDMADYAAARTWRFGAKSDNTIDTDRAMAVKEVSTDAGALVKKGAGELTLPLVTTDADGLDVREGAVAARASLADILGRAALHVDASDADSLETVTDEKGTQVVRWNDTRGNGLSLVPCEDAWSTNKPYLVTETVGGAARSVVSIGDICSREDKPTLSAVSPVASNATATAFRIRKTGSDANVTISKIREFHFVLAEQGASGWTRSRLFTADSELFSRNEDNFGYILGKGDGRNDIFRYGSFYGYDGNEYAPSTFVNFGAGYHQGFYAVTNASYSAALSFLGGGKTINSLPQIGGQKICEIVVFTELLTDEERRSVVANLRRKWLGADVRPKRTFGAVTVASGASFSLTGDIDVKLASLSAPGAAVNVTTPLDLSDQTSFTFDFMSPTDYGRIVSTGPLTVRDGAEIRINVKMAEKLPKGVYPLLTGSSVTGTPATVPVVTAPRTYAMRVEKTATAVNLVVKSPGLIAIIR